MNRNADIRNELQVLASPLADMPYRAPFAVPEGYFATLTEVLQEGVIAAESVDAGLPGMPKAVSFTVPENYFNNLAESLVAAVLHAKPALPYKVPDKYFSELPAVLLSAATKREASSRHYKAIAFRPYWRIASRMAAAAVLVLGLSFGSYQYLRTPNPDKIAMHQLSKLDDEAINAYVEQHVDEFDAESLEAAVIITQGDVPAVLSNLDAAEIQDYLQDRNETM